MSAYNGAVGIGLGIDWQRTTQDALANRSVHLSEVLLAFRHLNGHSDKAVSRLVNKNDRAFTDCATNHNSTGLLVCI